MNPVFVVRLSAIGDTIIAARSAATLAAHGCDVVFVTHVTQRDIVEAIDGLRGYVLIDENNDLTWFLKTRTKFEVSKVEDFEFGHFKAYALDLQNTGRSRRAIKKIRSVFSKPVVRRHVAKRTLYRIFLVWCAWLFGNQNIRRDRLDGRKIVRIGDLQQQLVASYLRQSGIEYKGPVENYLNASNCASLNISASYVLIFLGASFPLKAWPKEHIRVFIRDVLEKTDQKIVLCGGESESAVASYLSFDGEGRIENLVGKTSLTQVLTLAKKANFILTNDSFGAHLADAFKKNASVVFGSTSPLFGFAPAESNVQLHYANLRCSPCARHGQGVCRYKNLRCLTIVTPDEVSINFHNVTR